MQLSSSLWGDDRSTNPAIAVELRSRSAFAKERRRQQRRMLPRSRGESGGRAGGKSRGADTRWFKLTGSSRNSNAAGHQPNLGVLVSLCLLFAEAKRDLPERRPMYEEKKRDPRLLEEKERAATQLDTGPHEASAAGSPSSAARESRKAPRHLDEIGTPRIVVGPPS
jgi:hypothetical protein